MNQHYDIVQVSDISVGFGNYDSLNMVQSMRDYYRGEALILEPDQPDKPIRKEINGMAVRRIATSTYFRSTTGRIEFVSKAAQLINQIQPKILIIRCSWNIPILLKLRRKPSLVLYHATESTLYYGNTDPALNRLAAPWIDSVVFPEENRAALDVDRCGFHSLPVAIAYNCPVSKSQAMTAADPPPRNGRVMYSGALDRNATYVDYYAEEKMRSMPIDLYGYVGGHDSQKTKEVLESLAGNIRYKGYVATQTLEAVRREYAFSITIWNPSNENQRFACPCKFFESIAALVPPITAPHPQCKMLVERYECGIVMDDWSFKAFHAALVRAMKIYGTSAYEKLVDRCRTALLEELNWDHQFDKVKKLLPVPIGQGAP